MQSTSLRFQPVQTARFIVVEVQDKTSEAFQKIFQNSEPVQSFEILDTECGEIIAVCFCEKEKVKSMAFALNTFHGKH